MMILQKLKFFSIGLCFILCFFSSEAMASKIAQVISSRAIIYSDVDLKAPIGHVSNGKLIPVGNPLEGKPEIVPLIISGRLAYVHILDIRYVSEDDSELEKRKGAPREHNIDGEFQTADDKLTDHNYVHFYYGMFDGGTQLGDFFESVDGTRKSVFHRLAVGFLHRVPNKRMNWGVSFEYMTASSSNATFSNLFISPEVTYALIQYEKFAFELYGTLNLGAGSTVDVSNNYAKEPSGWLTGADLGVRVTFPISRNWSMEGALGLRKLKVYSIQGIEYPDGTFGSIDSLQGIGFYLGFSTPLNFNSNDSN